MEELKAQETEALDILEAMLDVCDLDNPGPMFAGQHIRGGICKITDDDAAKLRQYIADRRAATENKALTCRGCESEDSEEMCEYCSRAIRRDCYARKPEGSDAP
jgi:recombinational DNA repair protein RecR